MIFCKKYYYIIVLILLAILPGVLAAPPSQTVVTNNGLTISTNIPNSIPLDIAREWEVHVLNSTTLFKSGVTCNLHIYDEGNTGEHLYQNSSSNFSTAYDIEFNVPATVHNKKGIYSYKVFCNTTDLEAGIYERNYYVTKSGLDPAGDNLTLFIYILFIISVIGLFYTFFLTLVKVVTADETFYNVLISWGSFILVIIVNYLAGEYLLRTFVEDLTASFITITAWTNVVLPLIALIITFFIKGSQKRKPLTPQEIGGFKYG